MSAGPTIIREDGFTVLEILCALAILALVLGVSMRIVSGGADSAIAVNETARALATAQTHLAILEAKAKLEPLERSGLDNEIGWREVVAPASGPDFSPPKGYAAWRLSSEAGVKGGRTVRLETVRLLPR